jgi:RNA-directed DNA polymerase
MTAKLKVVREEMRRRMHIPIAAQHQWLSHVLRGHYGYYGVVSNSPALSAFAREVRAIWFKALRHRRQKSRMNFERFEKLLEIFPLPRPVIHECWEDFAA